MEGCVLLTQRLKLLDHMKQGLPITAHSALVGYVVSRLAPRILELKHAGWPIAKKMVRAVNREGKQVRVAEYWLESA